MTAMTGPCRAIFTAIFCIALAACAATPPAPVEELAQPDRRARQLELRGDDTGAAGLWEQAAQSAEGPLVDGYRLNAADAWLRSGDRERAFDLLTAIDASALSNEERARLSLILAEQALDWGDIATARRLVGAIEGEADPALYRRVQDFEARLRQVEAGAGSELLRRIAADLGPDGFFNLTEAVGLLARYEFASSARLLEAAELSAIDPRAAGWADLMRRIRAAVLREDRLTTAAEDWVAEYPGHPVGRQEFLEIAFLYAQRFPAPRSVAVLLPTVGGLAAAGNAIRDGLLSAFLSRPEMSELRFYPAGESTAEILATYRRAWQEGADWVIGPVRQSSVQAIAELGLPDAPTLALNDLSRPVEPGLPANFHTLSLSQESEAALIAERMYAAGIERVITLTTDNAWGSRMEAAFVEAFVALGGRIMDVARFSATDNDHSPELTRLLQIDQSRERRDRLEALLGVPLVFEPRLRDDFDAFFMSSTSEQARQIRPQLRFYDAGDKPLFAASRVYSGIPDPAADRDLNGIVLLLGGLQLDAASAPDLPGFDSIRGGSMLNLFALGADAWNLMKWLPLLRADQDLLFPGASGRLSPTPGGAIQRRPEWARIEAGRPVHYEPSAALDR